MYIIKQLRKSFLQLLFFGLSEQAFSVKENKLVQENIEEKDLTPEQERIESLKKELETLKSSKSFIGKMESNLRTRLLKDGDPKDKEFQELAEKVKKYQEEVKGLSGKEEGISKQLKELLNEINNEIKKILPVEEIEGVDLTENVNSDLEKEVQYDGKTITEGKKRELLYEKAGDSLLKDKLDTVRLESRQAVKEAIERGGIDFLSAGDVYMMKEENYDISKLFLISEKGNVSKELLKVGDELVVNFGTNKEIDNIIGAGDLLDINKISEIEINGIRGIRGHNPRPGYYNSNGEYLPIHNNYKIKIVSENSIQDKNEIEEYKKSSFDRFKDVRSTEILKWLSGETLAKNDKSSIKIPFSSISDIELLNGLISDLSENLKFNKENLTITSTDGKSVNEYINKLYEQHSVEKGFNDGGKNKSIDIGKLPNGVKGLLDFLSIAEGTNGNYNAIYGKGGQNTIKFTEMSLIDVLKYQKRHAIVTGSSAIGKYQFMQNTLKDMIKRYNIDPNTKFDEKFQDNLATKLMQEVGLQKYLSGNLDKSKFQYNLSKKWASLPKDSSGVSFYHGDKIGNHALVSHNQFGDILDKALS